MIIALGCLIENSYILSDSLFFISTFNNGFFSDRTGIVRVMQFEGGDVKMADTAAAAGDMVMASSQNESRVQPYIAPYNPFVVPVNGFISPALITITLVTNCAVCAVLLRPHMRSPTNILLVAIATSDMLTG